MKPLIVLLILILIAGVACNNNNPAPTPDTQQTIEAAIAGTQTAIALANPTITPTFIPTNTTVSPTALPTSISVPTSALPVPATQPSPPVISDFSTTVSDVDAVALSLRKVEVPVSWTVTNRPINSNLVFEQLIDSDTAYNVELPRNFITVPSSGIGALAPFLPGGDATQIRLRLRLIDTSTYATLTSAELVVPVVNQPDSSFVVDNRSECFDSPYPTAQGLQIGGRGQVRGENPAGVALSASNGIGEPLAGSLQNYEWFAILDGPFCFHTTRDDFQTTFRQWRVRSESTQTEGWAYEYAKGVTGNVYLLTAEVDFVIYDSSECYDNPFLSSVGIEIGDQIAATRHVPVMSNQLGEENYDLMGYMVAGDIATVLDGPFCIRSEPPQSQSDPGIRQWLVRSDAVGQDGWIFEYATDRTFNIELYTGDTTSPIEITSFTVSPNPVAPDGTITIAWETTGTTIVDILTPDEFLPGQPSSGSVTRDVQTISGGADHFTVRLTAQDGNANAVVETAEVTVISDTEIVAFAAQPSSGDRGSDITLSWQIDGDFTNGSIAWEGIPYQAFTTLTVVNSATGSVTATLPDDGRLSVLYRLSMRDSTDLLVYEDIYVGINCPYTYFVADPDIQGDTCPVSEPQYINAAYQQFEHGFMVWDAVTTQIYLMLGDGTLHVYDDTWNDEDIAYSEAPPDGLLQPMRGFGKVWVDNESMRIALGWGTAVEQGYTMTRQQIDDRVGRYQAQSGPVYITLPDGHIVRYTIEVWPSSSKYWAFVP